MWTLLLAVAPAFAAAPAASETPKSGATELSEVSVSAGADPKKAVNAVFVISIGECKRGKGVAATDPADCVVSVALKKGGSGKQRLEWTTKSGAIARKNDNHVVIGPDPDNQMALRWSSVVVGNANQNAGLPGLLITQETLGDKSKRRHDLFLARGGKLDHAFTAREGRGGRTWSNLSSVDVDNDGGAEMVLMLASTKDEEQADTFEMQVYGWRADVKKIVARNDLRPQIKAGVVVMTKSLKDARTVGESPCARELVVLDNKSADLLPDGTFVLAYPAASQADAELALEAVRSCSADLVGTVKVIAGGVDVDGGDE